MEGNERSDELTKTSSATLVDGPERYEEKLPTQRGIHDTISGRVFQAAISFIIDNKVMHALVFFFYNSVLSQNISSVTYQR